MLYLDIGTYTISYHIIYHHGYKLFNDGIMIFVDINKKLPHNSSPHTYFAVVIEDLKIPSYYPRIHITNNLCDEFCYDEEQCLNIKKLHTYKHINVNEYQDFINIF